MADSSFEMEFYSPSSLQNHLHLTSHFGTSSSSHHKSDTPTPRRTRNRPPATPFASDNDMSWQGELSWQFEPTSWHASSNLSAALNPWTPMPPSESRILRRSANDYYHSRSKGFRDFRSPYHDYSGYGAVSAGRLVLQSYVARGGTGSGPLATKDELNMIKYESQEHEFLHGSSHKGNYHHHGHDLSHMHSRYDHCRHEISHIVYHGEQYSYVYNGHGISHGGQQTPSHHFGGDDQYNDSDKVSAYEEDDDDEGDGAAWLVQVFNKVGYISCDLGLFGSSD